MTDRELLELAAKAAGYEGLGSYDSQWGGMTDYEGWQWNPLADDGDALRLAVRLRLDIDQYDDHVVCWREDYFGTGMIPHDADPDAATRRAIVRAAAEIGRTKP